MICGVFPVRAAVWALLAWTTVTGWGCSSPEKTLGATAAAILLGAQVPGNEIEQIYYIGVFDPIQQIPETVYRLRVRGQASVFSKTRFASGWVPAPLIDSLTSSVGFGDGGFERRIESVGPIERSKADSVEATTRAKAPPRAEEQSDLSLGRRLVMFGPEGFRTSPAGHRLVLVMGADPNIFFKGIERALLAHGDNAREVSDFDFIQDLLTSNQNLRTDRELVEAFVDDFEAALPHGVER